MSPDEIRPARESSSDKPPTGETTRTPPTGDAPGCAAEQQIQESEARFRALFDNCADGVMVVDAETRRIIQCNPALSRMLGYSEEELVLLAVADVHPKADLPRIMAEFESLARHERHFAKSIPVLRKDGSVFLADISASRFLSRGRECMMGMFRDITDRQQAEERSRIKHDLLLALGTVTRVDEGLQLCLEAAIQVAGLDAGGFYLLDAGTGALHLRVHRGMSAEFISAVGSFDSSSHQAKMVAAGQPMFTNFSGLPLDLTEPERGEGLRGTALLPVCHEGRPIGCLNVASHTREEISPAARMALETVAASAGQVVVRLHAQEALRENERLRDLSVEVLRILNDPQALPESTQRILNAIRTATGVEAVGIRLRKGRDYPYAASAGFSAKFLQAENSLAVRNPGGEFCLDEKGEVRLECTCGLVLSGQTDATNPLFTSGGSAWTNDARPFLHVPADQDPRLNPRNRCIHEGYQSVALIPIRVKQDIIGLLQLNDRNKGRFSLEMVQFLEGLASSFGVALQRLHEEQAVRESEEQFRQMFETAAIGMAQTDPATARWLRVNRRFCAITGYSEEELLRMRVPEITHPEDRTRDSELFQSVVRGERPEYHLEKRYVRKDGTVVWVNVNMTVVRDAAGRPMRTMAAIEDITTRKDTEAALRISEERLRLAAEAAHIGTWERDLATGRLNWSEVQERLMGYEPGSFPGTEAAFMELLHPESREVYEQARQRARTGDGRYEAELRFVCPDGRERWGLVRGRVQHDEEGRPERLIGVDLDITGRKQAEATLATQMAELQRWYEATRGREGRVLELKEEVNRLLVAAGQPPRYGSVHSTPGGHSPPTEEGR